MKKPKIRKNGEERRNFLKTVLAGAVVGAALLTKGERAEAAPAKEILV